MSQSLSQISTCPLCQQSNACAVLEGGDIADCWCNSVSFPPKSSLDTTDLTASACICRDCIEKMNQEVTLDIKRVD